MPQASFLCWLATRLRSISLPRQLSLSTCLLLAHKQGDDRAAWAAALKSNLTDACVFTLLRQLYVDSCPSLSFALTLRL